MNRKRIDKFLNRKGNNQGMFPSAKKCRYIYLYNKPICSDYLHAFQKPIHEYRKSFIQETKKSRKEEIKKLVSGRMYVNHVYIQSANGRMPSSFICMCGLSILKAYRVVYQIKKYVCIPAFRVWIKICKPERNTYSDTGFTSMYVLKECMKRCIVCM